MSDKTKTAEDAARELLDDPEMYEAVASVFGIRAKPSTTIARLHEAIDHLNEIVTACPHYTNACNRGHCEHAAARAFLDRVDPK